MGLSLASRHPDLRNNKIVLCTKEKGGRLVVVSLVLSFVVFLCDRRQEYRGEMVAGSAKQSALV